MTDMTYDHFRAGILTAVPADEYRDANPASGRIPAMADWVVATECPGPPAGFITDSRADASGEPSGDEPEDEDCVPFEAYDRLGRQITCTRTIRGALLAVGNRA
jgi:hypothetical protein